MEKSKMTNIAKQGAILVAAGFLVRFLGFLYRMPLTNLIGDKGNGIYSTAYYIYMFFLVVSSAGLPAAISKMVSERITFAKYHEAHKIFKASLFFAVVVGSLCMVILFIIAVPLEKLSNVPGSRYAIQTLAPTILIVSIMSVYRGYFQGMRTTVPTAISQIIEQILNAIFSILMAYILMSLSFSNKVVGGSLAMGAAGGTMGTGIGAIAGLITLIYIYNKKRYEIKKNVYQDKSGAKSGKRLLKELTFTAFPIIMGAAVFTITNLIDIPMVTNRLLASNSFTKDQATALYGQLTGKYLVIVGLPISISAAMATASIPDIAKSVALGKKDEVNKKINMAVKITMILAIPAAMGIGVLGKQILIFILPKHPEGGILLTVGAISIVFLSLTQIFGGMLQGISRFSIPLIAAICGGTVKIILNYFLIAIPKINVVGAVIGTIGCYSVASIINYIMLKKITKAELNLINIFVKPIFASIIMGGTVFIFYQMSFILFNSNSFSLFLSMLIGIVIYFVILYVIGGINEYEMRQLPLGNKIANKIFK